MPDGKLGYYYWHLYSLLSEHEALLDEGHPDYLPPDQGTIAFEKRLVATLVFVDGSRLIVRASLDDTADVREYDYAYVYLDAGGRRVVQYDDAPHHPEISTHPHHVHRGEKTSEGDPVHALDISRVSFATVLNKILSDHLKE